MCANFFFDRIASMVLLATMCVPLEDSTTNETEDLLEFDIQKERNLRMAGLLSFAPTPTIPKRDNLMDELVFILFIFFPIF
jgi:hypothetical protein